MVKLKSLNHANASRSSTLQQLIMCKWALYKYTYRGCGHSVRELAYLPSGWKCKKKCGKVVSSEEVANPGSSKREGKCPTCVAREQAREDEKRRKPKPLKNIRRDTTYITGGLVT
ncbi:hypothetical protein IG631_05310 [Alternaria alternata]|nr:hypothetical protein IG631_05310 [Alternaria alternata]